MLKTKLPPLSNASITAFDHCQRQYALRYLSELGWPLIPRGDVLAAEEAEQLGKWFHLAVEQRALGQDITALLNQHPKLHAWWLGFLKNRYDKPKGRVWHEARLNFPFAGEQVMVVMDRLQVVDGAWTIWDWKTGRRFERELLAQSWQTRLYRFGLAHAGQIFNDGAPVPAEAITMTYWSAEHDRLEQFPYDQDQYRADAAAVESLIGKLHAAQETGFPPTGKPLACHAKGQPCSFVPLCFEGEVPAELAELDELPETPDLDEDAPFI